jgi:hypothetical protein
MRSIPCGRLAAAFSGLLLAAASVTAQPPLTPIQDVIYRADGTRFQGSVSIRWGTFTAIDRSSIPASEISVPVVNGVFRASLVPTTNAIPRTNYTVRYNGDGRTQAVEYWSVPQSQAALKIGDVRTSLTAGDQTVVSVDTQIQVADVVGLPDALAVRPTRAVDYVANHVLMANPAGELQSVLGADGDCIRVDGSTGPCGGGSVPEFVDAETPAGTVDGANASFVLEASPFPVASLQLFRNGLLQKPGLDYSLSDRNIEFNSTSLPQAGDLISASYRTVATGGGASVPGFVDGETPAGTIDGVNSTFLLNTAPAPAASLHLYRNGVLLRQNADFLTNGATISFVPAGVPQSGDILVANYRVAAP